MLNNLTGWHALIVLAVILLIFGAAKLPALAKSVGQSVRILKNESRENSVTDSTETDNGHAHVIDPAPATTAHTACRDRR